MPCKNKLDVLYFVVASFTWLLWAEQEMFLPTHQNHNDISISDAETQSGNEHETSGNVNDDVYVDAQPSNNNDVEIEPAVDLDNPIKD